MANADSSAPIDAIAIAFALLRESRLVPRSISFFGHLAFSPLTRSDKKEEKRHGATLSTPPSDRNYAREGSHWTVDPLESRGAQGRAPTRRGAANGAARVCERTRHGREGARNVKRETPIHSNSYATPCHAAYAARLHLVCARCAYTRPLHRPTALLPRPSSSFLILPRPSSHILPLPRIFGSLNNCSRLSFPRFAPYHPRWNLQASR